MAEGPLISVAARCLRKARGIRNLYNEERPHSAIGNIPCSCWQNPAGATSPPGMSRGKLQTHLIRGWVATHFRPDSGCSLRNIRGHVTRVLQLASPNVICHGKPVGIAARICQICLERVLRILRTWIARRLGLESKSAKNGDWWEIDLILVILLGAAFLGAAAWFSA